MISKVFVYTTLEATAWSGRAQKNTKRSQNKRDTRVDKWVNNGHAPYGMNHLPILRGDWGVSNRKWFQIGWRRGWFCPNQTNHYPIDTNFWRWSLPPLLPKTLEFQLRQTIHSFRWGKKKKKLLVRYVFLIIRVPKSTVKIKTTLHEWKKQEIKNLE